MNGYGLNIYKNSSDPGPDSADENSEIGKK